MPRQKKSDILEGLTEDQRLALHMQHFDSVVELKEEIASLVGKLRAKRKEVKADLGADGLAEIDAAIKMRPPEGEAKAKAQLDVMLRVARWHGLAIGAQTSMLDSLPPRDFKAEGKLAGLRGLSAVIPDGLGQSDGQLWLEGYHIGQAVLADGFGRKPGPAGDAEQKAAVDAATKEAEGAVKRKPGRPRKTPLVEVVPPPAAAANDDDNRDLRPPYARPEHQEHPALGTQPSTLRQI